MTPLVWDALSPSAQGAFLRLYVLCTSKFTGTVTLELSDGGIRELRQAQTFRGPDLAKLSE
jgi:hypothetical protein